MLIDWLYDNLMPAWVSDRSPDSTHPHRRRFTDRYRRKREIVKVVWIFSGLTMIVLAAPAAIVALALGTTFLSFVILDETD